MLSKSAHITGFKIVLYIVITMIVDFLKCHAIQRVRKDTRVPDVDWDNYCLPVEWLR